jgi:hypothetical protein
LAGSRIGFGMALFPNRGSAETELAQTVAGLFILFSVGAAILALA